MNEDIAAILIMAVLPIAILLVVLFVPPDPPPGFSSWKDIDAVGKQEKAHKRWKRMRARKP